MAIYRGTNGYENREQQEKVSEMEEAITQNIARATLKAEGKV